MNESTIELLKEYSFDSTELNLSLRNIEGILDLNGYDKLTKLDCYDNQITQIINLPNSLTKLICSYNPITSLDNLPNSLTELDCSETKITKLPDLLLNSLTKLYCSNTKINIHKLKIKYPNLKIMDIED